LSRSPSPLTHASTFKAAAKLMHIKLKAYSTEYRIKNTEYRIQKLMYIKITGYLVLGLMSPAI
jgi:hypothetical protein